MIFSYIVKVKCASIFHLLFFQLKRDLQVFTVALFVLLKLKNSQLSSLNV